MGTHCRAIKRIMWIFLRQIPKGAAKRNELVKFVSKSLRPSWMFFLSKPHAKIKRCEILKIVNPVTHSTECHGLVQINPSKAAPSVIERLNGHKLQGKPIEARRFFRRSVFRDRRRTLSEREASLENRRVDRRRVGLKSSVLRAPEVQRILGIL
jgi:hypothetical protein